jgi:hypothetical protein
MVMEVGEGCVDRGVGFGEIPRGVSNVQLQDKFVVFLLIFHEVYCSHIDLKLIE